MNACEILQMLCCSWRFVAQLSFQEQQQPSRGFGASAELVSFSAVYPACRVLQISRDDAVWSGNTQFSIHY